MGVSFVYAGFETRFAPQNPSVLGAKTHLKSRFWRQFEKGGSNVIICDLLATKGGVFPWCSRWSIRASVSYLQQRITNTPRAVTHHAPTTNGSIKHHPACSTEWR